MRRDKTVARTLLIFSFVNVVLPAPAAVRQGHLDIAKNVKAVSEKRDDESNLISSAPSTSSPGEPLPSHSEPVESTRMPEASGDMSDLTSLAPPASPPEGPLQLPHSGPGGSTSESDRYSSEHPYLFSLPLHLHQPLGHDLPSAPPLPEYVTYRPSDSESEAAPAELEAAPELETAPELEMAPELETAPELEAAPEADKFLNDELKQKIRDYAVLGTIAGVSIGIVNGVQKDIFGTVSPGAYVSLLFSPSPADI
jgi:hypothetical protein